MCGWRMSCSFRMYNFEMADVEKAWKHFELYEAECKWVVWTGIGDLEMDSEQNPPARRVSST